MMSDLETRLIDKRVVDCKLKMILEIYQDYELVLISFTDGTFWCSQDPDDLLLHRPPEDCPLVITDILPLEVVVDYQEHVDRRRESAEIDRKIAELVKEEREEREIQDFLTKPSITQTDLRNV